MTRRNITTNKGTDLLINGLVANGYRISGVIRIAIREYCKVKDIQPKEESVSKVNKVNNMKKVDEETQALFKKYLEEDRLCPNHPSKGVSKCGCIENGELLKRLMY